MWFDSIKSKVFVFYCILLSGFLAYLGLLYIMDAHHMNTMAMSSGNITASMGMGHEDHNMDGGGMHDEMSMMMHMTFYFGVEGVPILFKELTVNSNGGMAGACIVVCLVAMFYEGLKVLREWLLQKAIMDSKYATVLENENGNSYIEQRKPNKHAICTSSHWIQTLLHLLQVTVSYALMLIFMTYNAYLAISIVVGAGLGYFLFGWKKSVIVDINEHCH
ncbi:high affinity copper uptake protein 1-like [Clavelina lepadiformis]|uniref:high affinity copper uptake protein 1-like n=1 Tax=Clavelina lepadiformis TaxID=159417 RepID=UPI00404335D7